MPDFSTAATRDLNSLTSNNPWLIFIDLNIPGDNQHYVLNNENITWNNIDYTASYFELTAIPAKTTEELPEVTLSVLNSAELTSDIEENDGYIGTPLVVYYVFYDKSAPPAQGAPIISQADWPLKFSFTLTGCTIKTQMIDFTLGGPNYLQQQFPARLYRRDVCDFKFQGDYCWMKGKTPVHTGCNHTLSDCIKHWEEQNKPNPWIPFGGFPAVGKGNFRYR